MKIAIINKSDSTGGAAVVSFRLMEALRASGHDAYMIVTEKLTDSRNVYPAASKLSVFIKFVADRLRIFIANGFNRTTLFKIDTGETGLPLWRNPMIKDADAILINWVNQGMLSLSGVRKLIQLRKPIVWTMHDMWCMTGICHHAGICGRFSQQCGDCPLLGEKSYPRDLSYKVWNKKKSLYNSARHNFSFVAVSSWLAAKATQSSLLGDKPLAIIPNAFSLPKEISGTPLLSKDKKNRILFGAARLDDPIKGLDVLREMSVILKNNYPALAERLEIALFGSVKNPASLEGFALPLINLGVVKGEDALKKTYIDADILVSASSYETLPGTLVEAQAYGCIPVSFNQGGQNDIVDHLSSGYIATYDPDITTAATNLAKGIEWAFGIISDPEKHASIIKRMYESVESRFSYASVAKDYLALIHKLKEID